MRRSFGLLLLLACAFLIVGCAAPARALPTATPWPTPLVSQKPSYTVERGAVIDRFQLPGQVVPAVADLVFFPVDGRLSALNVTEGSKVKQGDVLAELEMKNLTDQLAQAQLSLQQAQDQLAQTQNSQSFALERAQLQLQEQQIVLQDLQAAQGTQPLQVTEAQVELEKARVNVAKAQADYDKVASRSDVGATPQAAALQAATLDLQLADARYKLSMAGNSDSAIAKQQIEVKLAQLAVQQLQAQQDPALQRTIAQATLQIDSLNRQIEDHRLRAPYDGQVIAVGLALQGLSGATATRPKIGDAIAAFAPLVAVARPDKLEIVVSAAEKRTGDLAVGEAVTVTRAIARDAPFQANVASIPVQQLGSGAQTALPQVVRISLPDSVTGLAIGDYVTIDVVSAIHANTLYLPPAALRRFGGRDFVVIEDSGRQRRVDVTLGLQTDSQVEILAGLQEGDAVVGQ